MSTVRAQGRFHIIFIVKYIRHNSYFSYAE